MANYNLKKSSIQTISSPPNSDKYQSRYGSQLTPQLLTSLLKQADLGYMSGIADVLDETRELDSHAHSVLQKREMAVSGSTWEVRPLDNSNKSIKAAKFASDSLSQIKNFSDSLSHLLSAIYHGRSACEIVWKKKGKYLVPVCLESIHARRLSYAGDNWELKIYDTFGSTQFSIFPGIPICDFPKGKFIVHTPRILGSYPQREGLGRLILWMSLFKRWGIKEGLSLAELSGRMARVGTFQTGQSGSLRATDEDKEILLEALETWSGSNALVIPDTTKIDFVSPVSGNTIQIPLIDFFNNEMSKAVLGNNLTTDSGKIGSRALGSTHSDEQRIIQRNDAIQLAESINQYLINPLIEYNLPGYPLPKFCFALQEFLTPQDIKTLKESGLRIKSQQIRDQFALEDPTESDEILGDTQSDKTSESQQIPTDSKSQLENNKESDMEELTKEPDIKEPTKETITEQ